MVLGLGGNNSKGPHEHYGLHWWWTKLYLADGRNLGKMMISYVSWKGENEELKKMHQCRHMDP